MVVNDNDDIMLINSDGIIIRINASEVSRLGRATQGVKIMKIAEDSNIIAIAKIVSDDNDKDDNSSESESADEQTTLDV